jgi:subtilisin family serine protease
VANNITKYSGIALLSALVLSACGGGKGSDAPKDIGNDSGQNPPVAQAKADPLLPYQWHLKNTGQTAFSGAAGVAGIDLNVDPVYKAGLTGKGVKVMVVDSGVEIEHEDLAQNIDRSMLHNFGSDATDPDDPTPPAGAVPEDAHGTGVAGIVAAVSDNGVGTRGVAPRASLGAVRFVGCGTSCEEPSTFLDAIGGAPFSRNADIFNASYGSAPTSPESFDPASNFVAATLSRLEKLRDGKGSIYLQAAGNEYNNNNGEVDVCEKSIREGVSCSNANLDSSRTMPQVIVVGAVNASGVRSSYSSAGSNLLISGLGGEFGNESGPALVSTDLSGCARGFSRRLANAGTYANDFQNPDSPTGKLLNPDCKYTSTMNGTSSAAPTVAGVVALMLEANPNLTWRDVRTILMKSARRVDASRVAHTLKLPSGESYVAEPAWTRNAAGLWFDNWYGFGLVNAQAAVAMARTYVSYLKGPMLKAMMEPAKSSAPVTVPPGRAKGAEIPLAFSGPEIGTIEAVQLSLTLGSASMGDIAIELVSPSGTRSVLLQPYSVFNNDSTNVDMFTLASNAFNGESAKGTWKIRVIDVNARGSTSNATVEGFALQVFGH